MNLEGHDTKMFRRGVNQGSIRVSDDEFKNALEASPHLSGALVENTPEMAPAEERKYDFKPSEPAYSPGLR